MTRILVTGAARLHRPESRSCPGKKSGIETISVDIDTPESESIRAVDECDIIFHLAGINRPLKEADFETGNVGSLAAILAGLGRNRRHPLIVLSSSTQALVDNPYGRSKHAAENLLVDYCRRMDTPARIFRLPGVFGKWSRPNYNSVVATFCYNIARDLPIQISDPDREVELVHVDDVVVAFLALTKEEIHVPGVDFVAAEPIFRVRLGAIADKIRRFRDSRETLVQPCLADPFDRRLYATYSSYLPKSAFDYRLTQKADDRGVLAELLKLDGYGQIFVSRTHPGVTRGHHYHDHKVEKFAVLAGDAVIRFRNMTTGEIVEYPITGREMRVVDIPPGWTHSIENVGNSEMIVLFWASEVFDSSNPDTYAAKVTQ